MRSKILLFPIGFALLAACRPEDPVPKPRAYARVDTPASHSYQLFDQEAFPYSFEYPTYARISRDKLVFDKSPDNPYWLNINFPSIGNGVIYLSYKTINGTQTLEKLLDDAHFMSYYHTKRADYQIPYDFKNEYGVNGYLYEWGGEAASKYQFVATDSLHHFIRGALYFDVTPNADSLKPLNDFLKQDIQHLLKTMRWK
ncbi:hypothetical protein [Rurimicrobium arvi]|uniref:Gliding motility lipoprotein GldD n=1 Tax=Rurimicrobium arvi TaxID=2049916 RepID=A0ABP8MHU4_9BACT